MLISSHRGNLQLYHSDFNCCEAGSIIKNVHKLVSFFGLIELRNVSEMEILLCYQMSQNLAIRQEQLLCCEEGSLETSHMNFGELIGLHILFVLISGHLGNLQLYHSDFNFCEAGSIIKNVHKLVSFSWIAQCNYVFYI